MNATLQPKTPALALRWVLSLAILAGPYLVLRTLFSVTMVDSERAAAAIGTLGTVYPWLMIAYITWSSFVSPAWDSDVVDGTRRYIRNPVTREIEGLRVRFGGLTREERFHLAMRSLSFALLPGKFVWQTLGLTWTRLHRERR